MEEPMKIHKNLMIVALTLSLTAPAFAGGAGKVSFSDLSAVGLSKEPLEILSWSFSPSNNNTYTGQTTVNSGVLLLTVRSVPASLAQLCQSHAPIAALTIEADGQRREYRNVAFKDCAAAGTLTLTVSGQPAARPTAATTLSDAPNVTVTGAARMSCQNNLKQLGLGVHSATIYVGSANGGVWKTTDGGQTIPSVVIEGRGGTKLTFTNVRVSEVALVNASTQKITIAFDSTTATPQLVDAVLAGR
jgi:hypothetical protein